MINELVSLIKKRIAQGQTKEQLKGDFLKFGYSETDFETAYTEAVSHTESDTVLPPVKEKKATPFNFNVIQFLVPISALLVVAVAGLSAYAYFLRHATDDDFLPPEGEPFFKSQIVTNIEPTPLPIETTPSTETVSSTGTATSSTETVLNLEPSAVVTEGQITPSMLSSTSEIATLLFCDTILRSADVSRENLDSIKNEMTEEMLREMQVTFDAGKEPINATVVCIMDAVLPGHDLNQKMFTRFVNDINKKYGTDISSLSDADRLNLITGYELDVARARANEAAVKASVVSTLSIVLICSDYGTFTEPKEGEKICASQTYTWPAVSKHGGRWGGCETKVSTKDDPTFKYCAILPDGTVVVCNEDDCDFSGQN